VSSLRLSHLLQQFYRHAVPCFPVVEAEDDRLLGFVIRTEIDRRAADLDRLNEEFSRIPPGLLHTQISDEILHALGEKSPVPVLDELGREHSRWSRSELYRRMAALVEEQREVVVESQPDPSEATASKNAGDWLSQLILASIPHPLLATDLNGHTLFYNETFVSRILERGPFKNTLALAERYFLEVNRNALARAYSMGPHPVDLLFVSLNELHLTVEIVTLEQDRLTVGYLYIFHDPEVTGLPHEIMSRLEAGQDLDSIMEDLEAGIIVSMLRRTGQNVSHAAKALGVNRSTLQNKIRRLHVNERFYRRVEGPVRRIRKKREDSVTAEEEKQRAGKAGGAEPQAPEKPVEKSSKKNSGKTGRRSSKSGEPKTGKTAKMEKMDEKIEKKGSQRKDRKQMN
jgi:hypothetical protein